MSEKPFGGLRAATKYNPQLWSPEELRAIFVVRKQELNDIITAIGRLKPGKVAQHRLIIGPRGMGKTTLLHRVALTIEDTPELNKQWLPLRFPEEQYTVSTLAEFWANVLDALGDALERQGLDTQECDQCAASLAALNVEQREHTVMTFLDDWCAQHGKRLLLLIDNTDLLFNNLTSGKRRKKPPSSTPVSTPSSALWRLRKTLSHNPNLFWLGGSYQALEVNSQYHDAFLDFFQLTELRPLTLDEMRTAMSALAAAFGTGRGIRGEAAVKEIERSLNERPERLKTLAHLTGGNPRTTVILYELFAAGGSDNVKGDLEGLLDLMTPLYKARIEALGEQGRKILAHIMEHWHPINLATLSEAAHIPATTISPQLKRLELEGLIQRAALPNTTRSGYQVAERFFNIWYLMRNAPRRLRVRLSWLVEFLRLWYSTDELGDLARQRLTLYREAGQPMDHAYSRALATALPEEHSEGLQLEWVVFQQARERMTEFRELFDLDGQDSAYQTPEDYLQRLRALPARAELCPHLKTTQARTEFVDLWLGSPSLSLEEKERVGVALPSLSEIQISKLQTVWRDEIKQLDEGYGPDTGNTLCQATRSGQFFPDMPDSRLAYTQMLEQFGEQPQAYLYALWLLREKYQDKWLAEAIKTWLTMSPDDAGQWNELGNLLLQHLQRYNEAKDAYRQAIQRDDNFAYPWNGLGNLLKNHLQRYDEAEDAYQQAIQRDDNYASPWTGLGNLLLQHLQRYDEAEDAYRQAIQRDDNLAAPWNGLGNLFQDHLQRYDEAEEAYRQAIQRDDNFAYPWNRLGALLQDHLQRYDEAEEAYRQAIQRDDNYAYPWNGQGNLLQDHLQRYDEAEEAYRQAIQRDDNFAAPWIGLGNLLQDHLQRYDEAENAYRQSIQRDDNYAAPWIGLGNLFQDHLQRYEEAESALRKASELAPNNVYAMANLARLLARLERKSEAKTCYRSVLKRLDSSANKQPEEESPHQKNPDVRLQAQLWLNNLDAAAQALKALTRLAQSGDALAMFRLREQSAECHSIGLGVALAKLMENSAEAEFLASFSLALRAAADDTQALLGKAPELRASAEQVLDTILAYAEKTGH